MTFLRLLYVSLAYVAGLFAHYLVTSGAVGPSGVEKPVDLAAEVALFTAVVALFLYDAVKEGL